MTSAQDVETSVKVTPNSPSQDYSHPDDHKLRTYDMTPGFKPFTERIQGPGTCHHKSFSFKAESEPVISPKHPHLAASPDADVSYKCHGMDLYECKCPWIHRDKTIMKY